MWQFSQLSQGCIRYVQISNTAHGGDQLPVGKSVNIRSILGYTGKLATLVGSPLYKI